MSVLVVGLSHHSAPIGLLERVSPDAAGAAALAERLAAGQYIHENLVLATCNRLEVTVEAETFHGALAEIADALTEISGVDATAITDHLYLHYDERAVAHLFGLACGLDSMAVGEAQILGQLRAAMADAQRRGHLGPALNPLLQHALRVGKRAHAETSIDDHSRSLVQLGLDRAATVIEDLTEARAVVIGAGAMSGLAVATLTRAGIADVTVVNRTGERAERLAELYGVRAGAWADLDATVGAADLVVTCTGATGYVVDAAGLARARSAAGRPSSPLFLLDLALPRDIDPEVTGLVGVHLCGLAELQDQGAAREGAEAAQVVRDLVTAEVADHLMQRRAARLGPTLAALRASAARVVDAEMARLDTRLPHLAEEERAEVRRTVRRVVDKVLHTPTVRVKELQSSAAAEPADYASALRALFDLDPADTATVSRPDTVARTVARTVRDEPGTTGRTV